MRKTRIGAGPETRDPDTVTADLTKTNRRRNKVAIGIGVLAAALITVVVYGLIQRTQLAGEVTQGCQDAQTVTGQPTRFFGDACKTAEKVEEQPVAVPGPVPALPPDPPTTVTTTAPPPPPVTVTITAPAPPRAPGAPPVTLTRTTTATAPPVTVTRTETVTETAPPPPPATVTETAPPPPPS